MVAEALTLTGSIHDYPVVPDCDLNVHLSKLLESGHLSDVTLAVGDKEFKAHKAILAGTDWAVNTSTLHDHVQSLNGSLHHL